MHWVAVVFPGLLGALSARWVEVNSGFQWVGWITSGIAGATAAAFAAGVRVVIRLGSESVPRRRAEERAVAFASFLAGPQRGHLREEWAAVLAGDPDSGLVLTSRRRMRYALGFVWAALRMRVADLCAPFWVPVDWLLSKQERTNALIALVVGSQVIYIVYTDGIGALATEIWEPAAICGGALYGLARWLRRVRGIELAEVRRAAGE